MFKKKIASDKVSNIVGNTSKSITSVKKVLYNTVGSVGVHIKNTFSDKNELCLIFINIIIFMVIMTLFFHFVVAKEYDVLLEEKMNSLRYYISNDKNLSDNYKTFKKDYLQKYEMKAKEQETTRNNINKKLYIDYCIQPILYTVVLFILVILMFKFFKKKDKLSSVQIKNFF
jgi:uncharacterized membrane protein